MSYSYSEISDWMRQQGNCKIDKRGIVLTRENGTEEVLVAMVGLKFVNIVSLTNDQGSFSSGQAIEFSVQFEKPVSVTGVPKIILHGISSNAVYTKGSGTATLIFTATVGASDPAGSVTYDLNIDTSDGTIAGVSGDMVDYTLPSIDLNITIASA